MSDADSRAEIEELSAQIFELTTKLHKLQKTNTGSTIPNYPFETQLGRTTLLDLFAGHLAQLREAIERKDGEQILASFDNAKHARDHFFLSQYKSNSTESS